MSCLAALLALAMLCATSCKVVSTVSTISLNGVEATEENILAGDYLLSRPFVMATMGEISEQNEAVQTWFEFVGSDAGQEVISSLGLILPETK